ncbi:uncharacterized protein LOC127254312 isoform X1 [Andrographis paniculata]|uniref:uncharacterized protein LOC127254312 isoform X1 n=1 Tax=Andrographis paniculata TaxID=175694 RepID=UPI0021E7D041|nr:uncharacterized protein LOC127254312 isoform X1 [Andrographis paniculata]XP_051135318.1 uncharacterized protein LOC127254312 isoform X1 [Andrographis paniculata]
MADTEGNKILLLSIDCPFAKLPDHLLIEIFIRVPVLEWTQLSTVSKYWSNLFREECLWHAAIVRCFPLAGEGKRWPGPIPRGMSKRRFFALYTGKCIYSLDDELCEIVGHTYLFLKEELEISTMPAPSGILHGTIIDQFIACGKSRDRAHELASLIWLAVIENLDDNYQTFLLLKRLAFEAENSCRCFYLTHMPGLTKLSGKSSRDFFQIFVTACVEQIIMIYWLVPNRSFSQFHLLGWVTESLVLVLLVYTQPKLSEHKKLQYMNLFVCIFYSNLNYFQIINYFWMQFLETIYYV